MPDGRLQEPGTLYDLLGVDPTASAREVRAAYRRRLFETHPDHGGDVRATLALRDAMAVLGSEIRRHAYDTLLLAHRAQIESAAGPSSQPAGRFLPALTAVAPVPDRRTVRAPAPPGPYDRRWELRARFGPGGPRRRTTDPKVPTNIAM
jgi:curved DNA-binding protein CbpA